VRGSLLLPRPSTVGRPFDALESWRPASLHHEQPRDRPMGYPRLPVPCRERLLPAPARRYWERRRIRRRPCRRPCPPPPHLNRCRSWPTAWGAPGLLVELRYGLENRQARASGTLRIVVVRLGPAEERHHAVTEVLGDVTAEARYCFRVRAAHRLSPFLGIELCGDPGRPNHVAEQHRQMAPLSGWPFALRGFAPRCPAGSRGRH
jgi:hypothetical protein